MKVITIEIAPWAYRQDVTGEYLGIFPHIVKELEKRTNRTIKITLSPYARINKELESGRQDCTILVSDVKRQEITEKGEFLFDHPVGVLAKKGVTLRSYSDISDLRITLLRGSSISPKFDADQELKKEFDTDYLISLRKLQHGRVDAIAGAIPTVQYLAKNNGMADMLGNPLELNVEPIYLQCSKNSEMIKDMKDLNDAIKSIRDDSTLHRILLDNT
ncbi:substrate-binding periplasmic protein [Eionea flava]